MDLTTKDKTLYIDGCSAQDMADKYGTPLYIYSKSEILEQFDALQRDFLGLYDNARVAYAAKAFCTVGMCQLVHRAGLCIDVVSGGELTTALAAGFPPERIEMNGNNKSRQELELAVSHGIGRVIIDGLQELALLEDVCRSLNKTMSVLYRVTPGVKADTHDYIITGKKDSKFGIPLDDDIIYPAIEAAIQSPYVNFLGLHFHVGSQLFEVRPYLEAVDVVLGLLEGTYRRFGYLMTELNVGGGFGVRYTEEVRQPFSYFLAPVMDKINGFCDELGVQRPAVVIEPGRSIVAEAGVTLYTIGAIKDIPGVRKYVAVDGGMTDNIRPALYEAKYRGVVANKMDEVASEVVTVCGKCCESGDILMRDTMLPAVEAGDLLAVLSTGAYGFSMASNYNCSPIPAVVLVGEGQHQLLVARQTYDQMLANQKGLDGE